MSCCNSLPSSLRKGLVLTAAIAALLALVVVVVHRPCGWPQPESPPRQGEALNPVAYEQGRCIHSETALSRTIREPFNTWTNLAFVLAGGVLCVSQGAAARRQAGVALIAVGIGSFLYHASASRTLRHLDVGAMYWLYLMLVVLSVSALWPALATVFARTRWVWAVLLPATAILIAVNRNVRVAGWKPFDISVATGIAAGCAVVAMLVSSLRHGGWRFGLSAVALFGAAVACQLGDRPSGWLCNPSNVVQAHGMWHVLGAVACWIICTHLDRRGELAPTERQGD